VTLTHRMSSVRLHFRRMAFRPTVMRALSVAACLLWSFAPVAHAADLPSDLQIDLSSIAVSKDELVCLALNDYYEARSEEIAGRLAVARVVLNRAMDPRFPSNICDVIKQAKSQNGSMRCQFSWYCEHKTEMPSDLDPKAWRDSLKIAAAVLQRDSAIPDPTGGALWYHASFTRPNWALGFESTTIIGMHVFYREPDDLHGILPPRRPFIYRLNAFAEFAAAHRGRTVTVAMAPEAESSVAMKNGSMPAQPLAR